MSLRPRMGSSPRTNTAPVSGFTNPNITLSKVDLPAPFGPHRHKNSPTGTWNETFSRTVFLPYCTVTSRTSSTRGASTGGSVPKCNPEYRRLAIEEVGGSDAITSNTSRGCPR